MLPSTIRRSLSALALSTCAVTVFAGESIRIKGSDTIGGRLTPELAEAYHTKHPTTGLVVEALGSSTAFIGLCDGSADIGESSRPINERELANVTQLGLVLHEVVIGFDGVAVIVNPANPVRQLSIAQLSAIFTGRARNWKALGGPDLQIRVISRPSYSGTHAFFKEKVLRRGDAKGPEEFAPSTEFLEENGAIVTAVAADAGAISYVGLGWAASAVRAVPVSPRDGDTPIAPSVETVRSGRYPLYRSLLMYVPEKADAAARSFVRFVLSPEGAAVVGKNGFIPLDAAAAVPEFLAGVPSGLEVAAQIGVGTHDHGDPRKGSDAERPAPPAVPQRASLRDAVQTEGRNTESEGAAGGPETIRIYFRSGTAELSAQSMTALLGVAGKLKRGGLTAVITGNADSNGPRAVNERIALGRARAAAAFLAQVGVAPKLVTVGAAGSAAPVATNTDTRGRGLNRRVDIVLMKRPTEGAPGGR